MGDRGSYGRTYYPINQAWSDNDPAKNDGIFIRQSKQFNYSIDNAVLQFEYDTSTRIIDGEGKYHQYVALRRIYRKEDRKYFRISIILALDTANIKTELTRNDVVQEASKHYETIHGTPETTLPGTIQCGVVTSNL